MKPVIIFILGFLSLSLFGLTDSASASRIESYPLPSIYSASKTYSLKAGGVEIPVVAYSGEYDYAHFSMSKESCELEVTNLKGDISNFSISPKKLAITGTTEGKALKFTLPGEAYLIVAVNREKKLVIAIDPEETDKPASTGDGIFNVTAEPFNADKTGGAMATKAIADAIRAAAAYQGGKGIVYIPAGVYKTGNIELPSHTNLYLEGGAILRNTGNPSDYKVFFHKNSQNRDGTWFLYTAEGASQIKLYGRGTIDGNGPELVKNKLGSHNLMVVGCSDFTVDGLIVRDSGAWSTVTARARNIVFRNYKLFNRLNMGENDGLDVCESQNVLVQRAIGIALDDPFSSKTWDENTDLGKNWYGNPMASSNVTFDDCLAWTYCFGFKVGQGTCQPQDHIVFKNSVVYECAVGIGIHHKWGHAEVKNITFENIDIEHAGCMNVARSWIYFCIENGNHDGAGAVHDVLVKNITVRDKGTSKKLFIGFSEKSNIHSVTFQNIFMPGSTAPAKTLEEMGITDPIFCSDLNVAEPEETTVPVGQERGSNKI